MSAFIGLAFVEIDKTHCQSETYHFRFDVIGYLAIV